MEYEDVIGTNPNNDDDYWKMQIWEVSNLKQVLVKAKRHRNTHGDIDHTGDSQKYTPCVYHHVY